MNFTWSLTFEPLPTGFAEALTSLRIAIGIVLAVAALGTVLSVCANWTVALTLCTRETYNFREILVSSTDQVKPPNLTWRTETCSIEGRALSVVPAVARLRTRFSEFQERARSVAGRSAPSRLTFTFSVVGMTQLSVICFALASLIAFVSVLIFGTFPLAAVNADPASLTMTAPSCSVTCCTIFAGTSFGAVDSVSVEWALIKALVADKAGLTNTVT